MTFSTNISSPAANGNSPDGNPFNGDLNANWFLCSPVTTLDKVLSWLPWITPTPFELVVGKILRLSSKPLSFVIISTFSTDPPTMVDLNDIFGWPTAIILGGVV